MKDKYDKAVEYLNRNPTLIIDAWSLSNFKASCLFKRVAPPGDCSVESENGAPVTRICGCLTQVKLGHWSAKNSFLNEIIRADPRLPTNPYEIKLADLPVFAQWQRALDAYWDSNKDENIFAEIRNDIAKAVQEQEGMK